MNDRKMRHKCLQCRQTVTKAAITKAALEGLQSGQPIRGEKWDKTIKL